MTLRLISAGAAQGLVQTLAEERAVAVAGTFGAVGAMLEKLDSGESADVVILTRAQIEQIAAQSRVMRATIADLGVVHTAVAVRIAGPVPDVSTEAGLRAALLAADAIHFPDPGRATAGIHFAKVIDRLGLREELQPRLHTHPNGATAMRALADAVGHPIGCTQATEILATPGTRLAGPLPPGYALETIYTAAVHAQASDREAAWNFVRELTGANTYRRRKDAGFR